MIVATELSSLCTVIFLVFYFIWTLYLFKSHWIENDFNKGVRVMAVKLVRAFFPTPILRDILTLFCYVKVEVWSSSEVLLTVSVITVTPLMLLIYVRAKRGFIEVQHKFIQTQRLFKRI